MKTEHTFCGKKCRPTLTSNLNLHNFILITESGSLSYWTQHAKLYKWGKLHALIIFWKLLQLSSWTIVTLNYDLTHDLDPWFSRSNFEKVITQEGDARSTWNERDVNRLNVGPMLWLSTLTLPMTWTLNFQRQILKLLYPRNGRVDRHGTKGMGVDRVLYLLSDLELWPWPRIFTVKF